MEQALPAGLALPMVWTHMWQRHLWLILSAQQFYLALLTLGSVSLLPVDTLMPFQGSLQQRPHLLAAVTCAFKALSACT